MAKWLPASAELNRPPALDSLMYQLAPTNLVAYIPRSDWPMLRGPVPVSFSADLEARLGGLSLGVGGARPEEAEKLLGPHNFSVEESRGAARRYYLYLDGSVQVLRFGDGQLQGVTGLTAR